MNPLYDQMQTSIFERMSSLAARHEAINLGQGFPDFGWPEEILEAAARALKQGSNQYAPSRGLPALREAIADHYNRHHGLQLIADHVCVTSGATEALASAILATLQPGDEAIVFTPAYDAYAPLIRGAGATVRVVALRPPEWRLDADALAAAIGPSTRAIVFNNPHNPAGRLFDDAELEIVAAAARGHGLIVISDEVWEHILLNGQGFRPLASLPGMAERVIKCGSAGKIFSLTGWKIGWLVATPELATVAARARDRMAKGLRAAGYAVLDGASTYFQCVDLKASGIDTDDETFARLAVEQAGVAVVPLSAFAEQDPPRHMIRLCFAKQDRTIDAGVAALAKARDLAR